MTTAGRIAFVVALLVVAWIAVFGGNSGRAPDGPVLPTTTVTIK